MCTNENYPLYGILNSYHLLLAVLAWHPVHETLFASGGSDGAILFWEVGYVIFTYVYYY